MKLKKSWFKTEIEIDIEELVELADAKLLNTRELTYWVRESLMIKKDGSRKTK